MDDCFHFVIDECVFVTLEFQGNLFLMYINTTSKKVSDFRKKRRTTFLVYLSLLIYYIMYTPKDIFNKVLKLDRVGLNYSERTTFFSAVSRHSMFLI